MAVELATGYVSLLPSARGFKTAMATQLRGVGTTVGNQVSDEVDSSMSSKVTGTFKKIATVAVATGAIIGAAGGGLAAWGLKSAAGLQQTQIAFEGIFGSSQVANQFLGELRTFAARTPFEFPELATASKQLLATGFSAESVIPTMTKLGNVAATLGVGADGINNVVRALGQMKGKGKASAEELQQISEAIPGFSAIGAIAESMGISTSEAFDLMAQGAIPADQAIDAILAGMDRFPGAAGAMERQALTLNGVLSTMKDTIRDALVNGIAPVLPTLAGALQGAAPAIGAAIGNFGVTFGNLIATILPTLGKLLPIIGELANSVSMLLGGAFEALGPVLDAVGPPLASLGNTIAKVLLSAVQALAPVLAKLLPPLIQIADVVLSALEPVFNALAPVLSEVAGLIADVLLQALTALRPVMPQISRALGQIATALGGALLTILKALLPVLPQLIPSFVSLALSLTKILVALTPILPPLAQLIGLVARINATALAAIAAGAAALADALVPIAQGIGSVIAAGLGAFVGFVQSLVTWIAQLDLSQVVTFFTEIPGAVGNALSALPGVVAGLLATVLENVTGWIGDLLNAIGGVPGLVLGLVGQFLEAGAGLGEAIIHGIKDGIVRVAGFAADIASALLQAFKDAWNTVAQTINDFIPNDIDIPLAPDIDLPDNPVPKFAKGGIVPGPIGAPMFAIVHGGERISRVGDTDRSGGGGGLFDGATVHIGDRNVIPDLDFYARTRGAGV